MAGRGAQTFKKRQKEQQRREKQQEKFARRLQRKHEKAASGQTGLEELTGLELQSEQPMSQDADRQTETE